MERITFDKLAPKRISFHQLKPFVKIGRVNLSYSKNSTTAADACQRLTRVLIIIERKALDKSGESKGTISTLIPCIVDPKQSQPVVNINRTIFHENSDSPGYENEEETLYTWEITIQVVNPQFLDDEELHIEMEIKEWQID